MRRIKLTQGKSVLVDNKYFNILNKYQWKYGCGGYAYRNIKNGVVLMHRELIKTPKGFQTDHINRNKLDNRIKNLRICTASQNQFNIQKWSHNSTGYRGIIFDKESSKFRVRVGINGKKIHIGRFSSLKIAVKAYRVAIKNLYGEFVP